MKSRELLIYLSLRFEGDWEKMYEFIVKKITDFDAEEASKMANSIKYKAVTILDDDYPEYLKRVYKPPFVIFYYGDFSLMKDYLKCFAVIGSRKHSEYGELMTTKLTAELSKEFIIVSGLAKGIDSIAHKTAIENGGKTIGILGSGIDCCYPKESAELYNTIKENHLIISEYPGNCEPSSNHFPMRNRLIACLSRGLLVTDANYRSGTSITVSYALEMGRAVCCVPHLATEHSLCNRLIMDGAKFTETVEDIFDELNYKSSSI